MMKCFKDLIQIVNHARQKIFELTIVKLSPVYEKVIEAEGRVMLSLGGEVEIERVVKGLFGELAKVVNPFNKK